MWAPLWFLSLLLRNPGDGPDKIQAFFKRALAFTFISCIGLRQPVTQELADKRIHVLYAHVLFVDGYLREFVFLAKPLLV